MLIKTMGGQHIAAYGSEIEAAFLILTYPPLQPTQGGTSSPAPLEVRSLHHMAGCILQVGLVFPPDYNTIVF